MHLVPLIYLHTCVTESEQEIAFEQFELHLSVEEKERLFIEFADAVETAEQKR